MKTRQVSKRTDVYTRITNQIVQAIENGAIDYEMPWHVCASAGLPKNPVTSNMYHGVNTVALWATGKSCGYVSPYWASFRQWQSVGANVIKGEHGSVVVFYKREQRKEVNENSRKSDELEYTRAVLRYSFVFNSEQVEGWEPPDVQQDDKYRILDAVEEFIRALGSDIRYGSDSAYYSINRDRIYMPYRRDFLDTKFGDAMENFYAVLFHEHIHWSGHFSRLNRDLSGRFGASSYAMEELIAELGAAFQCASRGISSNPRQDHAAYIASWLKILKEQKSAIFVAASAASVASQFLETLFAKNKLGNIGK